MQTCNRTNQLLDVLRVQQMIKIKHLLGSRQYLYDAILVSCGFFQSKCKFQFFHTSSFESQIQADNLLKSILLSIIHSSRRLFVD